MARLENFRALRSAGVAPGAFSTMERASRTAATFFRHSSMPARLDFRSRHLGPIGSDRDEMLRETGYASLPELIRASVPAGIRMGGAATHWIPTS